MVRLIWLAFIVLAPSIAAAAPFQAAAIQNVEVRDGALNTDPVVALIEAGAEVTIIDCLLDQCILDLPGLSLINAAWVDDEALVVDATPASQYAAAQRRSVMIAPIPAFVSKTIRAEGDSYMRGARGVSLHANLAKALGRKAVTTAEGGSEMGQIADRFAAPENLRFLSNTTVIWDGSNNAMASVVSYADEVAGIVALLGHERFVIIPPMHGSNTVEVAAEFSRRWPDNYLDWRDVLGDHSGIIPDELLAEPAEDKVHLGEQPMLQMADTIAAFIRSKGW